MFMVRILLETIFVIPTRRVVHKFLFTVIERQEQDAVHGEASESL